MKPAQEATSHVAPPYFLQYIVFIVEFTRKYTWREYFAASTCSSSSAYKYIALCCAVFFVVVVLAFVSEFPLFKVVCVS